MPKYKRYVEDPAIPVPKRTLYNWKKNLQDKEVSDDGLLNSSSQEYMDNLLLPALLANQQPATEFEFVTATETEIASCDNAQQQPESLAFKSVDDESFSYMSDSSDSFAIDTSEDESAESTDVSEEESPTYTSDEEEQGNSTSTDSNPIYTAKELASMAIISYATRYLLSGEAATSLVALMKLLSPENQIFTDLTYSKIQQMHGNCNLKVHDYCEICYGLFPDDKEIYRCQTTNCSG